MSALTAWPAAAAVSSIATIIVLVLSRRIRPHDAALWHGAWLALALASIAAPLTALLPPIWQIVLVVGPANPATTAWPAARVALAAEVIATAAVAGTLVLGWRLIVGLRFALRLAREAAPLSSDASARIDQLAPGLAGLCRTHTRIRVPVAVGGRRGAILLPESWTGWPDGRLRAILRHEHAHIVRRDFIWNVIAAAYQALYWWNPLAWVVARRIRFTAEVASDRDAAGDDTTMYTGHLVAAARDLAHSAGPSGILAPGVMADLSARVDSLLSSTADAKPAGRLVARALLVLVAAVVLLPMLIQARGSTQLPPFDHAGRHAERHQAHGH